MATLLVSAAVEEMLDGGDYRDILVLFYCHKRTLPIALHMYAVAVNVVSMNTSPVVILI